jgi:hypothetical protein
LVAEETRSAVRASASSVLSKRNANRGSAVARVALAVGGASIARISQVVALARNTNREETATLGVVSAGGGKSNLLAGGDRRICWAWNASQNLSAVAAAGARCSCALLVQIFLRLDCGTCSCLSLCFSNAAVEARERDVESEGRANDQKESQCSQNFHGCDEVG